jgi:uncharacterized membrane protein
MVVLLVGLLLFLGIHSIRILAPGRRDDLVAKLGEGGWKGLYSLVSAIGLGLIIYGFAHAGVQEALWQPPLFLRHVAIALMALSFVLLAAAYVPGNSIRPRLGHPMVLAVKTWAFAHLLANGQPRDLLLFGAFLVWAIADYASLRRRDRAAGVVRPPGGPAGNALAVAAGLAVWALFAFRLHRWLIGVSPLG